MPSRWRNLALLALVVGGLAFAGSLAVYRHLPPLPRAGFVGLFLLALGEAPMAGSVRARLAGRPRTKPIMPLVVARYAVLAKASSLVGAMSAGLWAGLFVFIFTRREDFPGVATRDLQASGLSALASILLVVAAMRLEKACRVPPPPPGQAGDDRRDDPDGLAG